MHEILTSISNKNLDAQYTVEPRLTATLVIQSSHYYGHKNDHTFTWKETPVNTVIFLLWPNFFDPLVTILTGFHRISFLGFMLDWLLGRIERKEGFHMLGNTQVRNARNSNP